MNSATALDERRQRVAQRGTAGSICAHGLPRQHEADGIDTFVCDRALHIPAGARESAELDSRTRHCVTPAGRPH